jgi:HAD superfamily hydrolase (TIGR01509 family)
VPVGLASNTRRPLVELVLARAQLGPFDAIVTGDEAAPKPDPGLYREACRRLGVAPERACAVEDSPTGVRGAKAAGLPCIAVPSDPDNRPADADRTVDSLLELIEPADE